MPAKRPRDSTALLYAQATMPKLRKDVLYARTCRLPDGRLFKCHPDEIPYYAKRMQDMLQAGLNIPMTWEHQNDIYAMSSEDLQRKLADSTKATLGWPEKAEPKQGVLEMELNVPSAEDAEKLKTVRFISPTIKNNYIDSNGRLWPGKSIIQLAVTPIPVQHEQRPFQQIGLCENDPMCLSLAGYEAAERDGEQVDLAGGAYPHEIAKSKSALALDAAHSHSKTTNIDAYARGMIDSDEAHEATIGASSIHDHTMAARKHLHAADIHRAAGNERSARFHTQAAHHHLAHIANHALLNNLSLGEDYYELAARSAKIMPPISEHATQAPHEIHADTIMGHVAHAATQGKHVDPFEHAKSLGFKEGHPVYEAVRQRVLAHNAKLKSTMSKQPLRMAPTPKVGQHIELSVPMDDRSGLHPSKFGASYHALRSSGELKSPHAAHEHSVAAHEASLDAHDEMSHLKAAGLHMKAAKEHQKLRVKAPPHGSIGPSQAHALEGGRDPYDSHGSAMMSHEIMARHHIDRLNELHHAKNLSQADLSAKKKSKGKGKMHKVMGEFAKGVLKTSAGKKVTDKKQAIAIAYSEARRAGAKLSQVDLSDSLTDHHERAKIHAQRAVAEATSAGRTLGPGAMKIGGATIVYHPTPHHAHGLSKEANEATHRASNITEHLDAHEKHLHAAVQHQDLHHKMKKHDEDASWAHFMAHAHHHEASRSHLDAARQIASYHNLSQGEQVDLAEGMYGGNPEMAIYHAGNATAHASSGLVGGGMEAQKAHTSSHMAELASKIAHDKSSHKRAQAAHLRAANEHVDLFNKRRGEDGASGHHHRAAVSHHEASLYHRAAARFGSYQSTKLSELKEQAVELSNMVKCGEINMQHFKKCVEAANELFGEGVMGDDVTPENFYERFMVASAAHEGALEDDDPYNPGGNMPTEAHSNPLMLSLQEKNKKTDEELLSMKAERDAEKKRADAMERHILTGKRTDAKTRAKALFGKLLDKKEVADLCAEIDKEMVSLSLDETSKPTCIIRLEAYEAAAKKLSVTDRFNLSGSADLKEVEMPEDPAEAAKKSEANGKAVGAEMAAMMGYHRK